MQIEFSVYFFNLYSDYQRMFRKQIAVSVITVFGLSACNVDHTIRQVKDDADDGLAFFSSTAGNNITVTKKTEDGRMVCVRHGPDATYSETKAVLGIFSGGGGGGGAGEVENEMTGRTPAVVAVRDLLYNLCIANMNGVISNEEYVRQYTELQRQAFELYATEAEHTTISINEASAMNQSAASGVNVNVDSIDVPVKNNSSNSNTTEGSYTTEDSYTSDDTWE